MDDARLVTELRAATLIEGAAKEHLQRMVDAGDLEERNSALATSRQATSLRRELEKWITARALRGCVGS